LYFVHSGGCLAVNSLQHLSLFGSSARAFFLRPLQYSNLKLKPAPYSSSLLTRSRRKDQDSPRVRDLNHDILIIHLF